MHPIVRFLYTAGFLLLPFTLQAHDSTMVYPKHQVKFNPLKPFGLVNPGFELGYERRLGTRFATHVSAAYLTNTFQLAPYEAYSGYRIIAEQKYIFSEPHDNLWYYPSISFVYNSMNILDVDAFVDALTVAYPSYSNPNSYLDTFTVQKQTYSLNANFGLVIPVQRFLVDVAAGVGIKYRYVTHTGRINPNDKMVTPRHPSIYTIATNEAQHFAPNLLISIRIAYSF